jgi:hypothetical protein
MKYKFKSQKGLYIINFNNINQIEITIDYGFGPGISFCLVRSANTDKIDWDLSYNRERNFPQDLKTFIDKIIALKAFT